MSTASLVIDVRLTWFEAFLSFSADATLASNSPSGIPATAVLSGYYRAGDWRISAELNGRWEHPNNYDWISLDSLSLEASSNAACKSVSIRADAEYFPAIKTVDGSSLRGKTDFSISCG